MPSGDYGNGDHGYGGDVVGGGEDASGEDSGNGQAETIGGDDTPIPIGDDSTNPNGGADDTPGAADTKPSGGTGKSGSSCTASDAPGGALPLLFVCLLLVMRRRQSGVVA